MTKASELPVSLIGHRGLDDMLELYAAADLFALPSRRDPSPLSAIEAAAAGLPLLLSDRAGNHADLVVEGTTGWTFVPDQPHRMRDLVRSIASRPRAELEEVGRAATTRYREHFDSERCSRDAAIAMASLLGR
jgi:glycosyltransferase involved in cell wall biosynthesis